MSKVQIAKIYNHGEYKIFESDGVFSVVFFWRECSEHGLKKRQSQIGVFSSLRDALAAVYFRI